MSTYAHNIAKPRAHTLKRIKGSLEVEATIDTQLGLSDTLIAAGSIGYVLAGHYGDDYSKWLIIWPWIQSDDENTYGEIGSHNKSDLALTGRRG
jgi:hypothetical protein